MESLSLKSTGVIVRLRESGREYGMHEECANAFMALFIADGYSVLDADIPAVIISPLFANASEWECAYHNK